MKRLKTVLDNEKVEHLIYNDLDVMGAYPEYLVDNNKKHQEVLQKRLKELLLEGEFVEGYYEDDTYALTNYGRCIGGKKKAIISLTHSSNNIYMVLSNNRYLYSEELPNFDYERTIKRLKDLNVPLHNGYTPRKK